MMVSPRDDRSPSQDSADLSADHSDGTRGAHAEGASSIATVEHSPADTMPPVDADLFRRLVSSVRDYAIFALDATGHIMTWNEGAQRIKGYAPNEIIGRHFS